MPLTKDMQSKIQPRKPSDVGHASKIERTELPKVKMTPAEFSTRVVSLRNLLGWTQKDLAQKASLPQADITLLEKGQLPLHGQKMTAIQKVLDRALAKRDLK